MQPIIINYADTCSGCELILFRCIDLFAYTVKGGDEEDDQYGDVKGGYTKEQETHLLIFCGKPANNK